jgi:hypothetical protein
MERRRKGGRSVTRAIFRKSLTELACLATLTVALATTGAAAMALNNSVRINPPMNHVGTLGGGFGPHTDRIFGPGGGAASPQSFAECYRRAYLRLEKLDASMGYEFISATARHLCGA